MAREEEEEFIFVFLSGVLTIRVQKKSVWFPPEVIKSPGENKSWGISFQINRGESNWREVKGQAESQILQFRKEHETFETYVMQPVAFLTKVQRIANKSEIWVSCHSMLHSRRWVGRCACWRSDWRKWEGYVGECCLGEEADVVDWRSLSLGDWFSTFHII